MGLYERIADRALEVEGFEVERRERAVSSGFTRVTTVVTLRGGGQTGRGEDVTYDAEDHEDYPTRMGLGWSGSFDGFSQRLGCLDLFARAPVRAASREYRRWAFESAALDLALRQRGQSLDAALGLPYRPLRFVVSTRLDIRPWLALYPGLEFKLDPTPEWDLALMREVAATGSVRVLDFKAYYEGTPVDTVPDPALYRAIVKHFPDAIIEDPWLAGETGVALRGAGERLSWDAPIQSWADVETLATAPRFLNLKPSRFGSLARLLECVERASQRGMTLYGGGQFELDVGRGQIQALASLLYPDGPNDVAPMGYNEPEARAGLPASPLAPADHVVGFSFDGS